MIKLSIPLVAPSVNHYVKHTRSGRHYVTAEALAFKDAVALFSKGKSIRGESYYVEIMIYLAKKQKGDIDNFAKCCLDGLVDAGVIDSDSKVTYLGLFKRRDALSPRTEISIWEQSEYGRITWRMN